MVGAAPLAVDRTRLLSTLSDTDCGMLSRGGCVRRPRAALGSMSVWAVVSNHHGSAEPETAEQGGVMQSIPMVEQVAQEAGGARLPLPEVLYIEPTNRCNSLCTECPRTFGLGVEAPAT